MLIEWTDKDGDDFIQGVVGIKATRDDGVSRTWKLPRRLMDNVDIGNLVVRELLDEVMEVL